MLAYKNWTVFIHVTSCWGPPQYSSQQTFRLNHLVTPAQIVEGKKLVEPTKISNKEREEVYFLDQEYSGLYDDEVLKCIECYLNLPESPHPDWNPLNYADICELQQQDKQPLALQVNNSDNYVNLQLDDNVNDIICHKKDPAQPNWKNCVARINGTSYYQMVPPNDGISWWEKGYVRRWTNIIIIPSFGIRLIDWSTKIAKNIN